MQQILNRSKSQNTGINNFRNGNIRQIHLNTRHSSFLFVKKKFNIDKYKVQNYWKIQCQYKFEYFNHYFKSHLQKNSYYDKITRRRSFIN